MPHLPVRRDTEGFYGVIDKSPPWNLPNIPGLSADELLVCMMASLHAGKGGFLLYCFFVMMLLIFLTSLSLSWSTYLSLSLRNEMKGVLGHDSPLVMLYWARDNLGEWDEFCYISCPWCRINCSTCWPTFQHATTVPRMPPTCFSWKACTEA